MRATQVVVTGMGLVTAFGRGVEVFWRALREGASAIGAMENIPVAHGKDRAAQVKLPELQGADRLSKMLSFAIEEAFDQSGCSPSEGPIGLYIATTAGESRTLEQMYSSFAGAREASGNLRDAVLRFPNGALADIIAARFGLRGPREVNTNACASGNIALGRALCAIRLGQVRRAIVCGADELKASTYWGAERAGFVGHNLRPFHRDRDGSVLGEGAAALILEEEPLARARGARPLAELGGWGVACDENPQAIIPQLDGSANARAIALALRDAGVPAEAVDYFNAHGTGTRHIDRVETLACKRVFGARAREVPISSTKSLTGHLSAASPIVEAIACVLSLTRGYVHPTAQLDAVDPELDLDYVPLRGREQNVSCAVSNSMGGGGTNAAVVFLSERGRRATVPQPPSQADTAVVVTGLGAVTCVGEGVEPLWSRWLDPTTGEAGPVPNLDAHRYLSGEIRLRELNRCAQLTLVAAALAARDAGLGRLAAPERIGIVIGTALGGCSTWSHVLCEHLEANPRTITPFMALDHGAHLGATLVAKKLGATGVTCTLTSGVAAGLQAVGVGRDLIRAGICDCVVVGGADMLDEPLRHALHLLGIGVRGLSEGAACLVLERADLAAHRGARARGTVAGFGNTSVPTGLGRFDIRGEALFIAMTEALAGRCPDSGWYALSCARGLRPIELAEDRALRRLRSRDGHITLFPGSEKLGETFAAGGALAAVTAVLSLERGIVPGTRAAAPWNHALVNAVAPGGVAASLLLERIGRGGST